MDKVGEEDPGSSAAAGSHRAMIQHLVDSLASQLAVLDREGNIILVNEAWKRFARENAGRRSSELLCWSELPRSLLFVIRCCRGRRQGH